MSNIVIPELDTKPKKSYTVEIEGDKYTVRASVLIFRESTRYFNRIQKYSQEMIDNPEDTKNIDNLYDSITNLYEILLGEKKARKLIEKIDEKYDLETGQIALIQYSMLLYYISQGMTQEDIDNFFRSKQDEETK